MYNTPIPQRGELPSSAQLIRSTGIALMVALILLVTVVMPAEYGIDPTGVGRLIGLKQMGELKVAAETDSQVRTSIVAGAVTAPAPAATPSSAAHASAAPPTQSGQTLVALKPGESAEVKLEMAKGATVKYRWTVKGGAVNFDAHGEASSANISVSYKKGKDAAQDEGVLEAAFLGQHGWYWKNRGKAAVTIELSTSGEYSSIKRL